MSLDISLEAVQPVEIFTTNITHNLAIMADHCDLYECLWIPDSLGIKTAFELIPFLKLGIAKAKANRQALEANYTPPNNWGSYDGLLNAAEHLLEACQNNPNATVKVSR